jgi:hypothetical protein
MSLDRSWVYGLCLCNEYIKGLDAFIDFTKKDMLDNVRGNLCCPCKHCKKENKCCTYDVFEVTFDQAWIHGELLMLE